MPLFLPHYFLSGFLFLPLSLFIFSFSYLCFFLSILSYLSSLLCFFSSPPPSSVHGYPLLYHLPLWNLPLLSLNRFWLLVGISPELLINLLVVQPLPLSKVCWLHHSPFLNKITFLISYLSPFLFYLNG